MTHGPHLFCRRWLDNATFEGPQFLNGIPVDKWRVKGLQPNDVYWKRDTDLPIEVRVSVCVWGGEGGGGVVQTSSIIVRSSPIIRRACLYILLYDFCTVCGTVFAHEARAWLSLPMRRRPGCLKGLKH